MTSYPSSNAKIAAQLLAQFSGLIEGISYKMGEKYHLTPEDREDLISAARAKITVIKWRTLLKRSGGKSLNNYVISVIQTMMSKELRRIKAEGLSGLSKGPTINNFPLHFSVSDGIYGGETTPAVEEARDPDASADALEARELAEKARQLLSPREWRVVSLAFAFDGGTNRSTHQISRELDLPVSKVEVLLESSMQKLRRALR